jgi:hypothetical protein
MLVTETKERYGDLKKKRRHKRREYMGRYREQKLEGMTPEQRTSILERIRGIKNIQHFTERKMFIDMIKSSRGRY